MFIYPQKLVKKKKKLLPRITSDGADPVMHNAHHLIRTDEQQRGSSTIAFVHNRVCTRVNFAILKNVLCALSVEHVAPTIFMP